MLQRLEVQARLTGYRQMERDLAIVEYRLKQGRCADYEGAIESMTYRRLTGEHVSGGGPSDKTVDIALRYRLVAEAECRETRMQLEQEHRRISGEIDWMDFCIAQLDNPLPAIIRGLYIEKATREQVCDDHRISQSTLTRYLRRALVDLANMIEGRQPPDLNSSGPMGAHMGA